MEFHSDRTIKFRISTDRATFIRDTLEKICVALEEKGYDPIDQIAGYLVSGDPAYITSHRDARGLIRSLDRDELLEDVISTYLRNIQRDLTSGADPYS